MASNAPLALERTRSLLWQYESLLLIVSSVLSSRLMDEDNAATLGSSSGSSSSSSSSSSSDSADDLSALFDFPSLSTCPQVVVALKIFKTLGGTSKGQKGKAMRRRLLYSLSARMRDIMSEISAGMIYKGSAVGDKRRRGADGDDKDKDKDKDKDDMDMDRDNKAQDTIRLNPTLIRAGYLTPLLGDARLASSVLASDAMGGDDLVFEQFYGKLKKVKESKLSSLSNAGGVASAGEMLAAMVAAASHSASSSSSSASLPPLIGVLSADSSSAGKAAALPSVCLDTVDLCEAVTSSVDPDFRGGGVGGGGVGGGGGGGGSSADVDGAASLAKALLDAVSSSIPSLPSRSGSFPDVPDDDDDDDVRRRPPFSFTTDEVYGKYLDLSSAHAAAMQVPGLHASSSSSSSSPEPLSLQAFASLIAGSSSFGSNFFPGGGGGSSSSGSSSSESSSSPASAKLANRKKYHAFLVCLHEYLALFLLRVQPFLDLRADVYEKDEAVTGFEGRWKAGLIKGWEAESKASASKAAAAAAAAASSNETANAKAELALEKFKTPAELEKHLAAEEGGSKAECRKRGLKEGGSEAERIARLWSTRGVPRSDWPKKALAPSASAAPDAAAPPQQSSAATTVRSGGSTSAVDLAYLEVLVGCLRAQLRPTLLATVGRLARSATQTLAERAREVAEEVEGRLKEIKAAGDGDDGDEEEEAAIYNPKNIPLGWDGKPIPYWLYKLHGLNLSFPCEICGNESYRGRRAFEKHFTEPKHAFGMRCLGIPNTKHFHGVTGIEDAKRLWAMMGDKLGVAITEGGAEGRSANNAMEEYEDRQGNVLSRGAYEDLARQGLL